jgi:hypothetical protein
MYYFQVCYLGYVVTLDRPKLELFNFLLLIVNL